MPWNFSLLINVENISFVHIFNGQLFLLKCSSNGFVMFEIYYQNIFINLFMNQIMPSLNEWKHKIFLLQITLFVIKNIKHTPIKTTYIIQKIFSDV